MLYTQFNMDDALDVRYEEGVEDGYERGVTAGRAEGITAGRAEGIAAGRAEGIAAGRAEGIAEERAKGERRLIRLICAKLQRGDSPDKIAEDLLADPEQIDRICSAAETCGFDENAVYENLRAGEMNKGQA